MKTSTYILLCFTLAYFGCSSQKKLETSTPFVLGNASCQKWVGGIEESGSGEIVKITVKELTGEDISFQNIYFRGAMSGVVMEMDGEGMMATAKFDKMKPDIIMHADSAREVGNQPPKRPTHNAGDFPFELHETEAVLSYLEDKKVKYVKVGGIVDKPARIYPGRPQN